MAHTRDIIDFVEFFQEILPKSLIMEKSKELGCIKRQRKLDFYAFVWATLFSFATGHSRTLANALRQYRKLTPSQNHVNQSAFWKRFTPAFVTFLKVLFGIVQDRAISRKKEAGNSGLLSRFEAVDIQDSTVLTLRNFLETKYPGVKSRAGLKLHTVMTAEETGPYRVRVSCGRTADCKELTVDEKMRGRLLLIDMGYASYKLLEKIHRVGGFFITPAKSNADLRIKRRSGHAEEPYQSWQDLKVSEFISNHEGQDFDFEVEVVIRRRKYNSRCNKARKRFRCVCIWNAEKKRHNVYLTNVPVDTLTTLEVQSVYRARWLVELLFCELKKHLKLGDQPSRSEYVMKALIWSTLILLLISKKLGQVVRKKLGKDGFKVRPMRWTIVFACYAVDLLNLLFRPGELCHWDKKQLSAAILHEAIDPNVGRLSLTDQVNAGLGYP